jgi:hypothetical protein
MVSKKTILTLVLISVAAASSWAQGTDANWVYDSSKVSSKNMTQYTEFSNHQNPYPAKPRHMWELGISGGLNTILGGDVWAQPGIGGSISLRKALGHVISLRGLWEGSFNYGLDGETTTNYVPYDDDRSSNYNPWLSQYGQRPDGNPYVLNYKNATHRLALEMLVSLNNLNFYRGNPKSDWYLLAGINGWSADVDADVVDGNNNIYNYNGPDFVGDNRKEVRDAAKNILDGEYETNAAYASENRTNVFGRFSENQLIGAGFSYGIGYARKLSDRINIGIEQKFTTAFMDELDGIILGQNKDTWSATHLRLNINLGDFDKAIQPLWWVNPNNYVYNELNSPRHLQMKAQPCDDGDGDGVCDFFDLEPNTPDGCPVDTHGVTLDTDGDGVPDCKDLEKLTQKNCFPVDKDGVGKCPCPDKSCFPAAPPAAKCAIGALPSIQFAKGSATLSTSAKSLLNSVAVQLNANPACTLTLTGSDKYAITDRRMDAIIKYLNESGNVSMSRMGKNIQPSTGGSNTVDLMAAGN